MEKKLFKPYWSMRLPGYDYSQPGLYFVTMHVEDWVPYFGKIHNGIMGLNEYGCVVARQIQWLAERYPYVTIRSFVVMPEHIHVVLGIKPEEESIVGDGGNSAGRDPHTPMLRMGEDGCRPDMETQIKPLVAVIENGRPLASVCASRDLRTDSPRRKSLSELMGAMKTTSSKQIHSMGVPEFRWNRSFYEHIIRNEYTYGLIVNYINQNPYRRWLKM